MDWLLILALILTVAATTTLVVTITQQEKTIRYQRGIIDRLLSGDCLESSALDEDTPRQRTGA